MLGTPGQHLKTVSHLGPLTWEESLATLVLALCPPQGGFEAVVGAARLLTITLIPVESRRFLSPHQRDPRTLSQHGD